MGAEKAVAAAMRRQGVATWRELRSEAHRYEIETAVREGVLVRVARGRYALPRSPDPLREAIGCGGVVSHVSAAQLWFLETLRDPDRAHVTVPRRSRAAPGKGRALHWNDVDASDVRGRVTSPVRTVIDCARTMPFADALAIADSALRRELVSPDELRAASAASRARGVRAARRVVAAADGRAANPFESGLRAAVLEAGITTFVPQLVVRTRGPVVRVDLGDPDLRMVLEADSFAFHGARSALDRDCRRYDELVRARWLVLRFSWEQVMFERDWVAEIVSDTVAWRRSEHRRGQRRLLADRSRG